MDSVSLFVKTIIVLSFMWCLAEMVLPENSMRKYSSFIYGLVMISLAVSVFTKMNFDDFPVYDDVGEVSEYTGTYIKELYEGKINDTLREKFGDDSIKVELTDECEISKIYCDNKKTYDDIMRYINE